MLFRGMFYKVLMLLVQGVTFAILPLIAKELGNKQYSIWSVSYGFVQLLVPYIILQLDGAFTRFMSGEQDRTKIRTHFLSLLSLVAAMCLLVFISMKIFARPLSYFLYKDYSYEYLVGIVGLWVGTKG